MNENTVKQDIESIVQPFCDANDYRYIVYVMQRSSIGVATRRVYFLVKIESKSPPDTESLFDELHGLMDKYNSEYMLEKVESRLNINPANKSFEEHIVLTFQI